MPYILKIKAIGQLPQIEITESHYQLLYISRQTLSNALLMEEAYDLLVSNQQELEQELAQISVEQMMRSNHSYQAYFSIKASIARRIANLLTSARIYVDQIPRCFSLCMNDSSKKEAAKELLSKEYDQHKSFRFMETYRNHVQHYSATVDSMTIGGSRDQETMHLSFIVEPYAQKDKLALNLNFKRKVLDEMDEREDLRRMSRGYVSSISRVHHELRRRTRMVVNEARRQVQEAIATYEESLQQPPAGLHAIHIVDGQEKDSFPILLDWDETRQWLVDRNKSLADLARHYVTTELPPDKLSGR